jgi:phosphate-selective porin OprO and OprP
MVAFVVAFTAALFLPKRAFCQEMASVAIQTIPPPQASPTPVPDQTPQPSPTPTPTASPTPANPNQVNTIAAGESDNIETPRKFVRWNEYQGPYFTVRAGVGFLYEYAAFAQDQESKEQFALDPDFRLRDFRFLLKGSFPKFKRKVTWSAGIMFDGLTNSWLLRETGVMIAVPELWGNIFIGRTKEGFSLNKVMVGYAGWTVERFTMDDASIPILADGIKWLGYSPKHGFLWNLGYFNDVLSQGQSFSTYSSQEVARLVWLPIHSEPKDTLLHLGVNLRYGIPVDHELRLRSRPEAFPAPYFVDTGNFPATATRMAGYEAYYRRGPLLFGSEYWWEAVSSPSTHNPVFKGGDIVATWIVTGESRAYNTVGGYFTAVSPDKPVFDGGPGAWELVLQYSTIDLDSETVQGGKFRRITPTANWYLSKYLRLSFVYGYGRLERFGLTGNTQFFQTRFQLQL